MPYIYAGILNAVSFATPRGMLVCQYMSVPFYRLRLLYGKLRQKLTNSIARLIRQHSALKLY